MEIEEKFEIVQQFLQRYADVKKSAYASIHNHNDYIKKRKDCAKDCGIDLLEWESIENNLRYYYQKFRDLRVTLNNISFKIAKPTKFKEECAEFKKRWQSLSNISRRHENKFFGKSMRSCKAEAEPLLEHLKFQIDQLKTDVYTKLEIKIRGD